MSEESAQDRQRRRALRGIGSSSEKAPGLPSPPRRRRPALAAVAVLLIVGGAALAGLLALRLDSRVPVLVLAQDVPAGTEITADLLRTTDVASEGTLLIAESDANQVIGLHARTSLTEGQLLDTTMLQDGAPYPDGTVRVGVPLTVGLVPSGLRADDEVRLVRASDGSNAPEPLAVALVISTSAAEQSGGLAGGDGTGGSSATLLVPEDAADAIIDASGSDLLGIALLSRGVTLDDAQLTVLGGAG